MTKYLSALLYAAAVTGPAMAQTAPDVADLVGARAAGGETQLLSRGYELRQSNDVRDQRFGFWFNQRTGRCISVSTVDGRYASLMSVPAENCDMTPPRPEAAPGGSDPTPAQSLVLICFGSGNRPSTSVQPNYRWDDNRNRWTWDNEIVGTSEGFSSDVQIEIYGDHGRIHLGSSLVPPIHSGGSNGWWDLYDLVISPDRITASYRLNGLNKPKLSVDRRSGLITQQGMTSFYGRCDAGDWSRGQRRF